MVANYSDNLQVCFAEPPVGSLAYIRRHKSQQQLERVVTLVCVCTTVRTSWVCFLFESQNLDAMCKKSGSRPVNTPTCAAFTAHDPPQYYWPALSHIPLPLWYRQSHYCAASGQLVLTTRPTPTHPQSLWLGNSGRLAHCAGGGVRQEEQWVDMATEWCCWADYAIKTFKCVHSLSGDHFKHQLVN